MQNNTKAFTLVEMLVAMAVSTIIIAATYASYDLVATQYKKNIDVAEMHTSGRAVMQMIERDVRMAGFEYRDNDAKVTYGSITAPLVIKDSGNKCCDEVTVIYDYYDEDSNKVERIRIRYWTEPHTSNKGSRHRLYKQIDVLGRNNAILANPIIGSKDLLTDFVEDLQIDAGGTESSALAATKWGSFGIRIYDPITKNMTGDIKTKRRESGVAIGPDGYVYGAEIGEPNVRIYGILEKKEVGKIITNRMASDLIFDTNDLLYITQKGARGIQVFDVSTKKSVRYISTPRISNITFGNNGLFYATNGGRHIQIYNLSTGSRVGVITTIDGVGSIQFGSDGLLYANLSGKKAINIYDPIKNKRIGAIPTLENEYSIALINNLIYAVKHSGKNIRIYDTTKKKMVGQISTPDDETQIASRTSESGAGSLVTINLTLRTRNEYGKDRQFKKKDYHAGNYNLDKTDKYKRDTFSSTVTARNM